MPRPTNFVLALKALVHDEVERRFTRPLTALTRHRRLPPRRVEVARGDMTERARRAVEMPRRRRA